MIKYILFEDELKNKLSFFTHIIFNPKFFANTSELNLRNLYYQQGWIHATWHFYERGLIRAFPANERIELQIKGISEDYPDYFVDNTIRLLSKKFPKCTKKLFLDEQYLND